MHPWKKRGKNGGAGNKDDLGIELTVKKFIMKAHSFKPSPTLVRPSTVLTPFLPWPLVVALAKGFLSASSPKVRTLDLTLPATLFP